MWDLCGPRLRSLTIPLLQHTINGLQMRCLSQTQFSVIKIPVALDRKRKKEKLMENRKLRLKMQQESRMGNKNIPVITCKRPELNHYSGQTYSKFAEVPLTSKGWANRKSAGDYFIIHSHGPSPAFEHCESGDEDFTSLGLDNDIVSQLKKMGIETPTNIQSAAIPQVLAGKNTLITAETGNGKTLTFIAPMLQQIKRRMRRVSDLPFNAPTGLVIVPGRELAFQIHGVASQIGKSLGIKVRLLTGGRTKKKMLNPLQNHVDLLVASFGALSKLTTVGVYNMRYLTHIALDEVDTLLDDSFNKDVKRFISKQPIQCAGEDMQPEPMSGAQITLVGATLPRDLKKILEPIVNPDHLVNVSTPHLNAPMTHVTQRFYRVNNITKKEKLVELVQKDAKRDIPVIIFSNNSKTCDYVSFLLNENGVSCVNLTGNMPSKLRKIHYTAFMSGKVKALSCTDLTSRGLDTKQVSHVINFEFPNYVADYIHRCGRTGRVSGAKNPLVTNLVNKPLEVELVQKIEYAIRKGEEFHNVNANIKRILTSRIEKLESAPVII